MKYIRLVYRFILVIALVLWGITVVLTVYGRDPVHRSARDWRFVNRWMRTLCRIAGLRVHVSGQPANNPVLLVSNHISWHDIIVLQSLVGTGFVGKAEIRGWPLIGWLAHHGNTLFIKRGKRESFQETLAAMSERLRANQNIMLFPEGTTTTGESMLPFRSRLLEPALKLNLPIQPVAIWYKGKTMSCQQVAFVGDEDFFSHVLKTLGEQYIDVYVRFCEPVITAGHNNLRELGQQAEQHIAEQLAVIIKEQSLTKPANEFRS